MARNLLDNLVYNYGRDTSRMVSAIDSSEFDSESDEAVRELAVADYVTLLLALDTYMRYLEERFGTLDLSDPVLRRGLSLVRRAEQAHLNSIEQFIKSHLRSPAQIKVLERAVQPPPTPAGASRRATLLRMVLSRGGTSTMKAVFDTARARKEVQIAIQASQMEDEDAALNKFAAVPLKSKLIERWIDQASDAAQPGSSVLNDVQVVTQSNVDEIQKVQKERMESDSSPGSQTSADADDRSSSALADVEKEAKDNARRVMERNKEEDRPLTRSEVIGVAKAVATAVASDPDVLANVPEPLRMLDSDQRAAALTDGRVLVAAGAGAGKSTTLVSRIAYLVKDKQVNPARIMACSFNRKAADELIVKIAKRLGVEGGGKSDVQCDTMHSLFKQYVVGDRQGRGGYGNAAERAMLVPPRLIGKGGVSPISVSTAIRNIIKDCGKEALAAQTGFSVKWLEGDFKASQAKTFISKWRGDDLRPDEVKPLVRSKKEAKAYIWYDIYCGIKGDTPGWKPPCADSEALRKFNGRFRKGGERLGDLDDMVRVFRDILRRDPIARKEIQSKLDHILVDECQDLNMVQHEIFALLSEHVTEGSGKSLWMVGDPKQAIYLFRGARPDQFNALYGKEGWKSRIIPTNYRCEPEIVQAANKLISHSEQVIPMEARANPKKVPGNASIVVEVPADNTAAAIDTIGKFRDAINEGEELKDFAVLARTNNELNDFETACIINELPYVRQGGRGFLEAPESKALLGYLDLANGTSYESMMESLKAVLRKPNRNIFLSQDDFEKAVKESVRELARRQHVDEASVNPTVFLSRPFSKVLARNLLMPNFFMLTKNVSESKKDWVFGKRVEALEENILGIGYDLTNLRDFLAEGEKTTQELLDFVLDGVSSTVNNWDPNLGREVPTTVTLREQIVEDLSTFSSDEEEEDKDDEDEEKTPTFDADGNPVTEVKEEESGVEDEGIKGLGAIRFLTELTKPNAEDIKYNTDPSTAKGFVDKIERFRKLAKTLNIDPKKWEAEQKKITDPAQRQTTIPAITLSTVHKVKGAEWKNVAVLMGEGRFPLVRKRDPDEPEPTPEEAEAENLAERNLGYVALTRAAKNLLVVCPKGPSTYVHEAGLKLGENVQKEGAESEPKVVTASYYLEDIEAEAEALLHKYAQTDSYDWSAAPVLDWSAPQEEN